MNQNGGVITIDPNEWARTPQAMQQLVVGLAGQLQQFEQTIGALNQQVESKNTKFVTDWDELLGRVGKIAGKRPRQLKQAVFISDAPSTRIAKLAYGLVQNGWEVVLLHKLSPTFDIKQYFVESQQYSTPQEAALLASGYSPEIFHCFSSWNFETSAAVIKTRPGKVVFDDYDIFAGCLKPDCAKYHTEKFVTERFCLENADAICTRGVHLNVSKRKLGYKLPKKVIFFPEFCWNRPEAVMQPSAKKFTDELHAVYVGGFRPEEFDKPEGLLCVCDGDFIARITSRKIHYHMYPYETVWDDKQKERYRRYYQESATNPYFHFHEPLPIEQLVPEISRYHFGLVSMSREVPLVGCNIYEPYTHNLGTHNKGFDYLDANLMVVSYGYKVVERLLRGACVIAERSEVPDVLAQYSPATFDSQFASRIATVRHKLAVWRQAQRLIKFYSAIE